ncbi:hypothetical protein Alg130_10598, partial [Pyrenophora tritici-repentis]
ISTASKAALLQKWPSTAIGATGLSTPTTRSSSISKIPPAIGSAMNASSTAILGMSCSTTVAPMDAVLFAKIATMAEECIWDNEDGGYQKHVDEFNVCTDCERHFSSLSHLYQHRLSHRNRTYRCLCCEKKFKTYGGMIIHLECGTCDNTDYIDLNKLAAQCHKWSHFIYEDCREELLYEGDTLYDEDPFYCPTCDTPLPKLSSLFQHVESSKCEETLDSPTMKHLRNLLAKGL